MVHPHDRGTHCAPMDGILLQTTRSIRALIAVASEGAPSAQVDIAYAALRDQWQTAEREALATPPGSLARFDARAAAVLGAAYRPVLDVLSKGRPIASTDIELAQKCSGWLTSPTRRCCPATTATSSGASGWRPPS
jgi:hypothetical protein